MVSSHDHGHDHDHDHGAPGPLADASVRTARSQDVPAVGLVQAIVWRAAYSGVLPPEALDQFEGPRFAQAWKTSLESPPSPRHRLMVACAGEQVVGFVALGPSSDPDAGEEVGEVLALGVHPEARRAGHGSRLLNAAVDTLRANEFTHLHAWLLTDDEATRAFLVQAGLHPDGAYRDRLVDPVGGTAREVRLAAHLTDE